MSVARCVLQLQSVIHSVRGPEHYNMVVAVPFHTSNLPPSPNLISHDMIDTQTLNERRDICLETIGPRARARIGVAFDRSFAH